MSKRRTKEMTDAAFAAIEAGLGVIATQVKSKKPDIRFCPHGLNSSTTSKKEVRRWLKEDPEINLAATLKGTKVGVIDVDGPKGEKALRQRFAVRKTRKTETRNGSHRYYRYDKDLGGSLIKFDDELDVILSGYVMLPGSRHPDGGRYSCDNLDQPIAKMPPKLVHAILGKRKKGLSGGDKAKSLTKGGRNNALTSIAGALRRQGHGRDFIATALHPLNSEYCKPPLRDSEVERIAASVSRYEPEHDELFQLMAEVTPRNVEFLWNPYFVRGAVNLLEGDSNVGKTYFLCWLAAVASADHKLPDGQRIDRQKVLLLSAEDDPETTLVKRMIRMGADRSRIWVMKKFLRLDEDVLQLIEKHVVEHGISVILMDPLLAYMQGGIDMNKANETRPFMARLAELAKDHNITIIALRHLNKSSDMKAIHRGLGSVDITAASRSAVMIGLDPEDEDVRVFTHAKHNLSRRGTSLLYTLEGASDRRVPKLVWQGTTELTAEDLAPRPGKVGRPNDASREAEAFLRGALADGARPIKDVIADAEKRAFSERTLRKVAKEIGVEKVKRTWRLPSP